MYIHICRQILKCKSSKASNALIVEEGSQLVGFGKYEHVHQLEFRNLQAHHDIYHCGKHAV